MKTHFHFGHKIGRVIVVRNSRYCDGKRTARCNYLAAISDPEKSNRFKNDKKFHTVTVFFFSNELLDGNLGHVGQLVTFQSILTGEISTRYRDLFGKWLDDVSIQVNKSIQIFKNGKAGHLKKNNVPT